MLRKLLALRLMRSKEKRKNRLTCLTECRGCLSFRRTGFVENLSPGTTGQSKAIDSGRLQKRTPQNLKMQEVGQHLELRVRLQWSVFRELHSKKTPVPPRDNRHPLKDPSGHPACRPYVPWPPVQLSTS